MLNEQPIASADTDDAQAGQAPIVEIVPVHPDKVNLIWDRVAPWLERSMEHGSRLYSTEDILACIMRTEFVLFVAVRDERLIGMTISSMDDYPQQRVVTVRWAGGEPGEGRDWLHDMIDTLKAWGARSGATLLAGAGRRGWLRGYGFRESGCLFEQGIEQ